MKDKDIVIRLGILIVVIAINTIAGFCRGRGIQAGDPLAFFITCLIFFALELWSWKNKKNDFIKQCIFAAPFALLLMIVFTCIGFESILSIYAGIAVFLFLIIKTENWKQHFTIVLVMAVVSTISLVFLKQVDLNVYKIYAVFGLSLPFVIFYAAYLGTIDVDKNVKLRLLLWKAMKFTLVLFLFFTLFILSLKLFWHYQVGFAISFAISLLIALGFLGVCYLLKINLSDSSTSMKNSTPIERKKKKESKLDELQNQLNEFYLEERKKSKSSAG